MKAIMQNATRFVLAVAAAAALQGILAPVCAAQTQPAPQAQTEFVPVDQLAPQEQLPAAPLLIAGYSVVWIAMFVYIASIWRRLQKVDRELGEVSRRIAERSRT